jgi:hypothetical protein
MLSLDEINHVAAVADALAFTIDQMARIDDATARRFPTRAEPAISCVHRSQRPYWLRDDGQTGETAVARNGQGDLFRAEEQLDLFGDAAPPAYRPDPDRVRARLYKISARRGRRGSRHGKRAVRRSTARSSRN